MNPPPVRDGERGFTLLEMLIAMALMALVMVGVLPLFTKSMSNNVEGDQLTEVTNRARQHVEELLALPITAPELTVPPGETVFQTIEMFSAEEERWIHEDDWVDTDIELFTRVTEVRQYSMSAINTGDFDFEEAEALDGSAPTQSVQIKEIVVRVNTGRPSFLALMGRNKAVTLRVFKSV